jgi:hypothetical protein
METVKLSELEQKVYDLLAPTNGMYVSDVADRVFSETPKNLKPKNPNNSIVSAIRQMNRKAKGWSISGLNRGSQGKFVWLVSKTA